MHKIYKKHKDGTWGNYIKVMFADGQVMDEDNHDFKRDGFFWSDEPPKEYLEYIENNSTFDLNK